VRVLGHGEPHDLSLAEHPHIRILGWEDMDPAEEPPNRWAERLAGAPEVGHTRG